MKQDGVILGHCGLLQVDEDNKFWDAHREWRTFLKALCVLEFPCVPLYITIVELLPEETQMRWVVILECAYVEWE